MRSICITSAVSNKNYISKEVYSKFCWKRLKGLLDLFISIILSCSLELSCLKTNNLFSEGSNQKERNIRFVYGSGALARKKKYGLRSQVTLELDLLQNKTFRYVLSDIFFLTSHFLPSHSGRT